jgi:molybdenum cofactor cytidylyltransferase
MTICLLLAAGSSSRMGNTGRYRSSGWVEAAQDAGLTCGAGRKGIPKMLLPFNGKTLLQHNIDEVKKISGTALLVVTGCYHIVLKEILQQQNIPFVQNENWEEGMGSSIQKGITHIQQHYSKAHHVIIMVCDQPYISSLLLQQLIDTKKTTGKGIVASTYNGTTGTPVLFDKKYFNELALLQGQQGAKKLVQQFAADTATIDFPAGAIDIDTPDDYDQLNNV